MDTSVFRTNLKTLLDADSILSNLNTQVYKYPPGEAAIRNVNRPVIGIAEISSVTLEDGTILASATSDGVYLIEGGVSVTATSSKDADWAAAEATANTLIERLRLVCIQNQTLSGICIQARVVSWSLTPTADNVFAGEWQITARVVG